MKDPTPDRSAAWSTGIRQLAAYALPNVSIGMLVLPAATIIPALYIKERALAPAVVGTILVVTRVFDAVADQAIGYLSDITRRRLPGGRKAWLVAGAALAIPSVLFLFSPPAHVQPAYFAFWSLAVYAAWAMLLIPYTAWGAELSRDYHERTRIVTARSIGGQIGSLAFLATPVLLSTLHLARSSAIDFHAAGYVAVALIVLLPVTIVPALLLVPQGIAQPAFAPLDLASVLRSLLGNRPLQIYLGAYLVSEMGYGFFATAIFFYFDAYLQSGSGFVYVIFLANAAMLVSMPGWERLSRRLGKKQAWALSWILQAVSLLALVFVPPGPRGFVAATVLICANSLFTAAALVVAPSILGDIVDYDTWKSGGYRAGNYFALYSLTIKIVVAVGGGLALVLLGWFHYDVVKPASNGQSANLGMLFVFAIAPAILRLLGLGVLWLYPLDMRRQEIIRTRLQQREERARRGSASLATRGSTA